MGEPDETEHYASWLTEESKNPADRTADETRASEEEATEGRPRKGDEEPDVLLDVPHLNVDEIDLEVDELRARVALQARVLDLLRLDVGADVDLGGVRLDIKGVQAQALLKVRLDNVESIIERVLQTIDKNPQIVEAAARTVADTAGGVADSLGRTAEGVTEGVGKAAEGVGGAAEGVGKATEGVGGVAEGAVAPSGPAGEVARDVGDSADIADAAPGSDGEQDAGSKEKPRETGPESSTAAGGVVPEMRTAQEPTENADASSGEPGVDQEGTDTDRSGEDAGPERSGGGSESGQADDERPGTERGTDGTEPEAAVERPEDRSTDDHSEDEAGTGQSEAEPETGQSEAERMDRVWAETEQVLSAAGQRLLKGLSAGAKQVGRELGGAASRVVRAAREGE